MSFELKLLVSVMLLKSAGGAWEIGFDVDCVGT